MIAIGAAAGWSTTRRSLIGFGQIGEIPVIGLWRIFRSYGTGPREWRMLWYFLVEQGWRFRSTRSETIFIQDPSIGMGKNKRRFVAKAPSGEGWRIWDNTLGKWWGQPYAACPDALLDELNGPKRPDRLTELHRTTPAFRTNRNRP